MLTLLLIYIGMTALAIGLTILSVSEDLIEEKGIPMLFLVSVIPCVNILVILTTIGFLYDSSNWAEALGYKLKAIIKGESK